MAQAISRALISFAFIAEKFGSTDGDIYQGLIPLFFPIVQAHNGEIFDPDIFIANLEELYDISMPSAVAQDWAPRLEKEGYLTAQKRGDLVAYKYTAPQVTKIIDGDFDEKIRTLLEKFKEFINKNPSRDKLPQSLDLEKEFFDRLLNLDSLAIFHRPDKPAPIARSSQPVISLKSKNEDSTIKLPVSNPTAERLDYLFGLFIKEVIEPDNTLFSVVADVTAGTFLAEIIFGMQSPPSKGDEFSNLNIYLDAPLVMDILGINPGMKDYALELLDALKKVKARIYIFDHSIEEIERVITKRVQTYTEGAQKRFAYQYTTAVMQADKLYLESLRGHVSREVVRLGLHVTSLQGDSYHRTLKYFSEDNELELTEKIGTYFYAEAKVADAKSLSNVIRLRGGSEVSPNVLMARAVMVSRNGRLVSKAEKYLKEKRKEARNNKTSDYKNYREGDAPICITDSYLLGLIWIVLGGTTKKLTRERIIANCATAITPRRDLVIKMFNLLMACDQQKADKFEAIMVDERAERYLMNLTLGDLSIVTNENVLSLYEEVRKATVQELSEEHERKLAQERQAAEARELELQSRVNELQAENDNVVKEKNNAIFEKENELFGKSSELNKAQQELETVAAERRRIESALESERRLRLSSALSRAIAFRKRFPYELAFLLFLLPIAWSKYIDSSLGNLLNLLIGLLLAATSFWDNTEKIFSPIRDWISERIFRKEVRANKAEDLLRVYKVDWVEESIIKKEENSLRQ